MLKYRLAKAPGSTYAVDKESVADAQRALRLIRSRATEWGLRADALGVMGFSAGAEVVARAAMRSDTADQTATDPVDRLSAKVSFQVLVYPGAAQAVTPENAPPTFMVSASDDTAISNSVAQLYLRLHQANVPVEMHVFASGAHGFGLGNFKSAGPLAWPSLLVTWLGDRGFVPVVK